MAIEVENRSGWNKDRLLDNRAPSRMCESYFDCGKESHQQSGFLSRELSAATDNVANRNPDDRLQTASHCCKNLYISGAL